MFPYLEGMEMATAVRWSAQVLLLRQLSASPSRDATAAALQQQHTLAMDATYPSGDPLAAYMHIPKVRGDHIRLRPLTARAL